MTEQEQFSITPSLVETSVIDNENCNHSDQNVMDEEDEDDVKEHLNQQEWVWDSQSVPSSWKDVRALQTVFK